jgi:tetratricopeptide (TPR) repeat protein
MKQIFHIISIIVVGAGWINYALEKREVTAITVLAETLSTQNLSSDQLPEFREKSKKSSEKKALKELIDYLKKQETGVDETHSAALALAEDKDNSSTFTGILLTIMTAGYAGIVFVMHILPRLAHRFTHTIYDSGAMLEKDIMSEARSKLAQGDYEGAIVAFRNAAEDDPKNRLPWVEIIKIHREALYDPDAAVETIREVLENLEWPEEDTAYFLFRLSELYDLDLGDRESAIEVLEQVQEEFPETRHSANAGYKIMELRAE